MAAQFCQCGNPQACICYQTPRRPDFHYNPFPPTPQAAWPGVYFPPGPPQGPNLMPGQDFNASPSFHQNYSFQHTFPTSFNTAVPSQGPSTSRTPLGNVTNAASAAPAATQRPKRKRQSQNPDAEPPRSRRRTESGPVPNAPSVYGVGPSASAADAGERTSESVFHPSLVNIPGPLTSGTLSGGFIPMLRPPHPLPKLEMTPKRPDTKEFSHVACCFCPLDKWRTWKNVNGQTSVICDHLKADHYRVWVDVVFHKKLKGWETIGASRKAAAGEREEFSLPGFYDRLEKWIAVDDQSLDVVDCPELRDLLLFIGAQLEDDDIPHRTKMAELITERFKVEYQKMIHKIQNAISRISYTDDIWSRKNLDSHLAITAHYIAGGKEGSGTQRKAAAVYGISGDSAEFKWLQTDREACFPHVVNIAVKTALKELVEALPAYGPEVVVDENGAKIAQSLRDDPDYWAALLCDSVVQARSLVTACRASGQRRDNFDKTVEEGNESGGFGDPPQPLRLVGLLKDVETRWSRDRRRTYRIRYGAIYGPYGIRCHPDAPALIESNIPDQPLKARVNGRLSTKALLLFYLHHRRRSSLTAALHPPFYSTQHMPRILPSEPSQAHQIIARIVLRISMSLFVFARHWALAISLTSQMSVRLLR
ncbi:hypothetical protein B0H14DRAFT_3903685 [Mycena olivaceomarginata]|nr:hypothetical protein B0H14DRAFT_3903685 [Mycena olivaceomarginata]